VAGGPYAIGQGSVTNANNPNYTITYVGANFTITPRPVTVTADAGSKVYGDADPALTFTTSSLGTGTAVTGSLVRAAGETVAGGPYAIGQGSVTNANNPNYTITYVGANFTITPRPLAITASNQSKTEGQIFTFTGAEFTAAGLVGGDAVTSVTLASAGAAAGATAAGSPYVIVAGGAIGSGLSNYLVGYNTGLFTVNAPGSPSGPSMPLLPAPNMLYGSTTSPTQTGPIWTWPQFASLGGPDGTIGSGDEPIDPALQELLQLCATGAAVDACTKLPYAGNLQYGQWIQFRP
jgi:hypothetical protein